ncbi:MAG: hypothetical protein OXC09_12390 [Truepera sp.]|nr:hypothetical protein [Truepera sp.]
MMADLKPYPAYKDSGVEWLGEVPEHWGVSTLRRKLRTPDGIKVGPFGSQLKLEQMSPSGYKVYGQANVIARDFARGTKFVNQEKFDELSACEVLPGDLLVTMMGTSGRCTHVPEDAAMGIMDSHLLRLRTDTSINVRFASRLIDESPYVKEQITVAGKGSIMHGLNSGMVKALVLALPPLPEQTAITRFLDYTDRRIQRYIQAKQKLIALLEEQRQAIIHQAVTGQIDVRTGQPYLAYKDSGVDWLGEVPGHWRLARLKDVAQVQTGLTLGNRDYGGVQPESRPYLSVANVQVGRLDLTHVKHIDIPPNEAARVTLRDGDVLMTEGGDIDKLGRGCVWHDEIPGCLHQNHIFAVRCRPRVFHPELLAGLMASQHGRTYFQLTAKQTTNLASTNSSTLRAFPVFLPPIREQLAIVDALSKQTVALNNTMDQVRREISLLNEYRTRLISDVATGKLDVREAAARLPEVDPLETEADSEESLDTGAESNLDELGTKVKEVVT